MRIPCGPGWAVIFVSVVGLAGCGAGVVERGETAAVVTMNGSVHGGQQPVSGSQVSLYAVSTTGNADAATSLLVSPGYVTTDLNGNFSITGSYTCPQGSYVYLVARGGNPGLPAAGTNNPELALAAGLGACSTLTAASFFTVNEVTTVAAAYSLAAMATSDVQVGSSNAATIVNAFSNTANLTDMAHGTARVTTPSGNGTVPQAKIDSLADSLAACINSDGTGMPCAQLMSAANVTGAGGTPVDTFQAALNIAHNPTANVGTIFGLSTPNPVFQPTLASAPPDWTITIQYPQAATVSLSPASATILQAGQQGFTASVSGATAGSYQWTTTATAGLLSEVGGGGKTAQTAYCSTSAQATYAPNANPVLNGNASDAISVQAFSGAGCVAANALGSALANVTIVLPTTSTTLPGFPTTTYTGTVVLPAGSSSRLDSLTVVDSVTGTTPSASGTFTLLRYDDGEQIVAVQSPSGNAMMLGWMDAAHPTISASTTAEVLAFFALGGMEMLNESDRNQLITKIPQLGGFPAWAQVVATELGNNPDAFAQTDPNLHAGLNAFFTSVTGITPQQTQGGTGFKPQDVTVIPVSSSPQSGVAVVAQAPESAYMTNDYRRRTHAFVTRVSDTLSGQDTPDAVDITNFEIPPTVGLSGGVTGAVTDVFNAYFGNQPTAYATQTTDAFAVPLTSGFDTTTYQVLNLGPGGNGVFQIGTLTAAQDTALVQVSVAGFVSDALVPFLSNFAFGSGFLPDAATTPVTAVAQFKSSFVVDLQNDFLGFLPTIPGEKDKVVAGDYKGVLTDLFTTAANTSTVRNLFDGAAQRAASLYTANGLNPGALATGIKSFNVILNAAGGVLQLFDSAVYSQQVRSADVVDTWTVKTSKTKVTLSPLTTTLNGLGNVQLTVAVPSVGATTGYSFHWKLTPAAGHALVGSFPSFQGTGTATDFCSSNAIAVYVNSSSAVAALNAPGVDTVTVTAFSGANCTSATQLGVATATVTTNPDTVTLSPFASFIPQAGQQALTAAVPGVSNTAGYSYLWTVHGAPGNAPVGALNEVGGIGQVGQTFYCSTSAQANYVPNASPALTQNVTDTVTVQAFSTAGCAPAGNSVGTSLPAGITVTAVTLLLTPRNMTITQTQQQTLLVQPSGGGGGSLSYQWTVSGATGNAVGLLNEVGGMGQVNKATYCSTSTQTNYAPNSAPLLTVAATDIVSVQAFNNANCTPASAVSAAVSTTVTVSVTAPLTVEAIAPPLYSMLTASDGNLYGLYSGQTNPNSNSGCARGTGNACGGIYVLHKDGSLAELYSLAVGSYPNAEGNLPVSLIEAPDGFLYGTTLYGGKGGTSGCNGVGCGTFFRLGLEGAVGPNAGFTVLHNFTYAEAAQGGPIVLGSDGNFYGSGGQNNRGINSIYKITPAGALTVLYNFSYSATPPNPYANGIFPSAVVEGTDGNFYGTTLASSDSGYGGTVFQMTPAGVLTTIKGLPGDGTLGVNPGALVAGADGAFYGTTRGASYNSPAYPQATVFRVTPQGQFSTLHTFSAVSDGIYPVSGPPIVAADGNIYGTTQDGGDPTHCTYYGGCGVVFGITPGGAFTPLVSFHGGANGAFPSTLFADSAGGISGTTGGDGAPGSAAGTVFSTTPLSLMPGLPPVGVTFADPATGNATTHVSPGAAVTVKWNVLNAFSNTMRQCAAFRQDATDIVWTGIQAGTASQTGFAGQASVTAPLQTGSYVYALTCGGTESGFGTLVVQ